MPTAQGSPMPHIFMMLAIFFIFYFILIRPLQKLQQKKQLEHQAMLNTLKKNDEVITTGGVHGTIVNVKEKTIVLRVDDNCRMEMEKGSIATHKKPRG